MGPYDVVSLKNSVNDLPAGAQGVIVDANVVGREFIVEFMDDDGRTLALEDLSVTELNLVHTYPEPLDRGLCERFTKWIKAQLG